MLKQIRKAIIVIVALAVSMFFLWGCSSFSFKTDYDPEIDMSGYKTYMWYAGKMPDDDALSANPLVRKRVAAGVDKVLQEKGFSIGTEDAYGYGGYGYGGYGGGWGGYGGYGGTSVYQYDETTLVIDIVDTKAKEMVYRSTVTGIVKDDPSIEEQEHDIHNVVTKMLGDFPPGK